MSAGSDVVLTGMPRSGSTLACELLNAAADTVALDEPIDHGPWTGRPASAKTGLIARWRRSRRKRVPEHLGEFDPQRFCDLIARFFEEMRSSLLDHGTAISKNVGGRVVGAKFDEGTGASGVRELAGSVGAIRIDKHLTPGFTLVVKHNTRFAAVLEHLVGRFRTYAVVRNPLAMLSSWQTVALPIREGQGGMATRFDEDLRMRLEATRDVVDRQFVLLEWFFAKYKANLPLEAVIRYEDVVASGGAALQIVAPAASALREPLENKNASAIYDRAAMKRLGERLLITDGSWWNFYTAEDIRALMSD